MFLISYLEYWIFESEIETTSNWTTVHVTINDKLVLIIRCKVLLAVTGCSFNAVSTVEYMHCVTNIQQPIYLISKYLISGFTQVYFLTLFTS